MNTTNKIEAALMAAAKAAASPESEAYAERLIATLLESGLSELLVVEGHKWAYGDKAKFQLRLCLTNDKEGSYGRKYGAVWDGWARQLVDSYHQKRVEHHYRIAQSKLLAAANILST